MTVERPDPLIAQEIDANRKWARILKIDAAISEAAAGVLAFFDLRVAVFIALVGALPYLSARGFTKRANKLELPQQQNTLR